MTNTTKERLDDVEWRLLDLEIARLKKLGATRSVLVTQRPKPAQKASDKSNVTQWRSTRQNSATLYEFRAGSGAWIALGKDRTSWPNDLRKEIEFVEKIDKARTRDGRIVSAAVGGGLKVK
jgi:hypothetical protein